MRRHNAFVCLAHGSWVCLHRPILPTPQLLVFVYLTNLPAGICLSIFPSIRLLLSVYTCLYCLSVYAPVLKKKSCSQSPRDEEGAWYEYIWQKEEAVLLRFCKGICAINMHSNMLSIIKVESGPFQSLSIAHSSAA